MKKLFIGILAMALVLGMNFGVIAQNDAEIDQSGDENMVKAYQNGSNPNNLVDVLQDGDLNETLINQGEQSAAVVSQVGDENFVDVYAGFNQYTEIDQNGNYNEATVNANIMGDSSWPRATDRKGTQLVQDGNYNVFSAEIYISQSFSKQIGNDNYISLTQTSDQQFATAFMNQEGDDNFINLTQSGGDDYPAEDHDRAFILQRGNDNVARLEQDGKSKFASEDKITTEFYKQDSTSTFAQLGDNNRLAGVSKDGNGLVLNQYAAAEQNSSAFNGYQDGDNNVIGLYQGNNDDGLITQDGDNNETLLYQGDTSGHTASITQNGDDNYTEVIQTNN